MSIGAHSANSYFKEKCTLMEGPLNQEIKPLQDKFKVGGRGDCFLLARLIKPKTCVRNKRAFSSSRFTIV